MQESGQKEVNFPSSFTLLMLRTCGVDAPHQWCGALNTMLWIAFWAMLYHSQRDLE
nr:hypothetical protein [uncultured Prevotella sp.]